MRELLKKVIHAWPWPLTLNERYDRQTRAVLRQVCRRDSTCIDVGCFRGDILRSMIRYAPDVRHFAFEPVPSQFEYLKAHFSDAADIYPYALGKEHSTATFHHVISNPTYSGLQKRQYKGTEVISEIHVEVRTLDEIIPPDRNISVIKIDVEGGEYDVLLGGKTLLAKWHPYIIFEHGIGAADKYGIQPGDVYDLLVHQLGYSIVLMGDYLKAGRATGFTKAAFEEQYWTGTNCYFLAVWQ